MTENMIRTQLYLPSETYRALVERAQKQGLTMAAQIRAALDEYLKRTEDEEEGVILQPDDPAFKMLGLFDSGIDDVAVNHDYYLYGAPKRKPDRQVVVREPKPALKKSSPRRSSHAKKNAR